MVGAIPIIIKEKNNRKKTKKRDQWVKTSLKPMDQLDLYHNFLF